MFGADKGKADALDGHALRIGVVQARFNAGVTDTLAQATLAELGRLGVKPGNVHLVKVPGALEVPVALQALADERDLRRVQRQLGVSERSLQRLVSAATGRPPLYWKRLARLRRAARALGSESPLTALAADHGFADQAHMNLEFQRWMGLTPLPRQAL